MAWKAQIYLEIKCMLTIEGRKKKKKKKVCILITLSEETEVEPEGTKYSICGQLLVNSKSTEGSQ